MLRALRDVVQEDRPVAGRVGRARPREPPRVGRPAEHEALERAVAHPERALVDLRDHPVGDGDDPQPGVLIDKRDARAVRRPVRRVAEAGAQRGDRLLSARSVGGPQRQLVLAAAVAPVGQCLAVGRPARIALGDAAGAGHRHHRPVFRRDADDLAARLEGGALAGRRDAGRLDQARHFFNPRLQRRAVGDHLHRHVHHLLSSELEAIQPAAGREDDVVRAERGEGDVVVAEVGHLPRRAVAPIERPEVLPLPGPAIGHEVDRVAVPHRELVDGHALRHVRRGEARQVERPDVRRPPAAIPLPRAVGLRLRHVGDARPVGRERPRLAVRHLQLLGHAPGGAGQIELVVALPSALAARGKQHALAVGMPVDDAVGHRMMGEAHGIAALRRDDVGVEVAVVVRGERDLAAIRREAGVLLFSTWRAEAHGNAAGLGHDPDVAGVDEGDLGGRDIGIPEHPGVDLGQGRCSAAQGRQAREYRDCASHHGHSLREGW